MQNISDELLTPRLSLLDKLGGISSPVVTNNEWLYLLTEETRNSILIEGYFVDKKSLQDVFSNKKYKNNSDDVDKAVNYHQAANTFYGLAYNDYVDKTDSFLTPAIIKTINSTLRQGDNDTGSRRDHIVITGSKHTPPDYVDIDYLIKNHFLKHIIKSRKAYMADGTKLSTYINSIAKPHCLSEAIHPFADGNGRTGRIFLNCMLIASGLPPVIIKGADNDRNKYYAALEEFDSKLGNSLNLRDSFYRIDNLINNEGNAELMTGIIYDSLLYSLYTFICNTLENKGVKISPIADIAPSMGYTADSLRVMVNRGQLIAKKAGKTWCSNEKLIIKNNMTEIESTI